MRLVHRRGARDAVLATDVDIADTLLAQARGLAFRRSIPDDYALVFPFDDVAARTFHMVFVTFDIDALWVVDDEVVKKRRLSAWTGIGRAPADLVVELPTGAADDVEVGDRIELAE